MNTNLRQLDEMKHFALAHDVKSIQFRELEVNEKETNDLAAVQDERPEALSQQELALASQKLRGAIKELADHGCELIVPNRLLKEDVIATASTAPKSSCCIPYYFYWLDHLGNARVCCGHDSESHIGNALQEPIATLRARQRAFRRRALKGNCSGDCLLNSEASDIV